MTYRLGVRRLGWYSGIVLACRFAVVAACGFASGGCVQDPRFARQDEAPAAARRGRAFVALDVHAYRTGVFREGRDYHSVATFANVAVGRDPPYFPADSWALFSTTKADHPDHVYSVEAGTYRLASLSSDDKPLALFALGNSPVTFTVRPGEFLYLGSLEWHAEQTSGIMEYQKRFNTQFAVADELTLHRQALAQDAAMLHAPAVQVRLITILSASRETQTHRPSLW